MLSICIPHYNFKNPKLFEALATQCLALDIEFEILIIDDASETENKLYLTAIALPYFNILFLEDNIGRAAIRNLLAKKAKYKSLLFLDADAEILKPDFIKNYLPYIDADIVCGGRIYDALKPNSQYLLHWNYGIKIEQNAETNFHSNNFLIKKQVFSTVKFNEVLTKYGYEDVVFGIEAKKYGYQIFNINNPVMHIDLKSNQQFLNDTQNALQNLVFLLKQQPNAGLQQEVKLVKQYYKLRAFGITHFLNFGNKFVLKNLEQILMDSKIKFKNTILAIYKLYYFHAIIGINHM
ncbi:glycosyltransferase family 2 protein [Pedobacter alpinus]|uniref:Glycosyltransferase family 2 protein n=1 Tax=Pedobacter alpinus TaxID=1590643 RepID=A0ABW5TSK2_9SPHI